MKIGMVDADNIHRKNKHFPNLSLMKLSAWHKRNGDSVEWYQPMISGHMDRVYVSKVFSDTYTPDITFLPDADEVIYGGSGYAITLVDGKEVYDKGKDDPLPSEVEHIMPDYSLYGVTDTAYGFITRGCPRGCAFCHVQYMQGKCVYDYSHLNEFWNGQKHIVLLDPNITASPKCVEYFELLARTGAYINFSQGLDLRLMTEEKWKALSKIKAEFLHFAWDNPQDDLSEHLINGKKYLKKSVINRGSIYVLTNFNSTFEQDLYRCERIIECGFRPYVMIYNKQESSKRLNALARWCNNPFVYGKHIPFSEYTRKR